MTITMAYCTRCRQGRETTKDKTIYRCSVCRMPVIPYVYGTSK